MSSNNIFGAGVDGVATVRCFMTPRRYRSLCLPDNEFITDNSLAYTKTAVIGNSLTLNYGDG